MTIDDIMAEYYAHHYADNPATESGEDDEWDTEAILEAMENGEWETMIQEGL